ncbi:MAG: SDR family NAD(P)-dependent oxidoreductase [Alphaproteobacteria bacterium]|nr:SDR family NAD(P)-dependent oxidoreductase [Alphaproteobacteria bacterium]
MKSKRTWLITGVSSGFGRAIAVAALERGDTVVGTVRCEADKEAFEALRSGKATGKILDVRDDGAIKRVVAEAAGITGSIDVLVNNAGYCLVGAIEEASLSEIRSQMEVNFFGAVAVLQAVLPYMRQKKSGSIFNITSVSGIAAWAGIGYYCASKHALEAVGKALAQEVVGFGIRVTNVAPGAFRTNFNRANSLSHTAIEIDDYRDSSGLSRKLIADSAGEEAGNPALAAKAIMLVLEAKKAPLHLLLGADAVYYAGQQQSIFTAEVSNWMPVSINVNHDDSPYGRHE